MNVIYDLPHPKLRKLLKFFNNFLSSKQVPLLYDGDLHQYEKVLTWLTSQDVFEIKNEIEEVNRKMLDKLLEENEFLTVFFCELRSVIFFSKFVTFSLFHFQLNTIMKKAQPR